jgi:endonuclease-3
MVNRKDAKRIFPEEIWNDLHLQMIWYGREYSPARGWDLENDTITKTVGRKTILNKYYKNKFHYLEIKLVKFIYLSTAIE